MFSGPIVKVSNESANFTSMSMDDNDGGIVDATTTIISITSGEDLLYGGLHRRVQCGLNTCRGF